MLFIIWLLSVVVIAGILLAPANEVAKKVFLGFVGVPVGLALAASADLWVIGQSDIINCVFGGAILTGIYTGRHCVARWLANREEEEEVKAEEETSGFVVSATHIAMMVVFVCFCLVLASNANVTSAPALVGGLLYAVSGIVGSVLALVAAIKIEEIVASKELLSFYPTVTKRGRKSKQFDAASWVRASFGALGLALCSAVLIGLVALSLWCFLVLPVSQLDMVSRQALPSLTVLRLGFGVVAVTLAAAMVAMQTSRLPTWMVTVTAGAIACAAVSAIG